MPTLHFQVKADKHHVLEYLITADKFLSAHPLIYKMESLGNDMYLVNEKVNFSLLTYHFQYKAKIVKQENGISIEANIMDWVKISMKMILNAEGEHTSVCEAVDIKTFLPVKNFMLRMIKKQHKLFFENIEKAAIGS